MTTPLQRAAWSGDLKVIRELLEAGSEVDERGSSGLTPLMFAAKEAKALAVRQLLKAGADVNAIAGPEAPFRGQSPLAMAVDAACVRPRAIEATIQLLLRAGARVDSRGADYWTPLMYAVSRPRGRTVEILLAAGANPNARSKNGITPLIALARGLAFHLFFSQTRAIEATVRHLLHARASVDRRDSQGWTALLYAAAEPRGRIVGLLLDAGADPNVQSRDGVTPLTAMEYLYRRPRPRKDATTRLLLAAGAKMPMNDPPRRIRLADA